MINDNKKIKKYPNISNLSNEFGAMIEDFQGQLGIVAEQTSRIPHIDKKLERVEDNMEILKTDMELVKYGLRIKVDIVDFKALERRVATLESRR
jgi:archaellum component FlaC